MVSAIKFIVGGVPGRFDMQRIREFHARPSLLQTDDIGADQPLTASRPAG